MTQNMAPVHPICGRAGAFCDEYGLDIMEKLSYDERDGHRTAAKERIINMINKDMTVGQVLRSCADEALEAVVKTFTDMGMHCLFCPHSSGETLEQAAMVHGNDVGALVEQLNAVYKAK